MVADDLPGLVAGMNRLARGPQVDVADIGRQVLAREHDLDNAFSEDIQLMPIASARRSRTDRLIRVAMPHRILDPAHRSPHRGPAEHLVPQDAARPADNLDS